MVAATPDPLLLWTIDKLEQALAVLRPTDELEGALRAKIEEAIETGYEVAYSRPSRHLPQVIDFPGRRRTILPLHG